EAHVAKGQFEQASKVLEKLIQRGPQNAQHRTKLQFVRSQMVGVDTLPQRPKTATTPPMPALELELEEPAPSFSFDEEPSLTLDLDETPAIELDLSAFSEPAPAARPAAAHPPPPPRFEPELELAEEVPEESGEDLDFITEHLTEAEVFAKYGLAEKAAEHLRAVIERAPKHTAAHDKLFRILLDEGDVAGARTAATQYVALLDERGDSETADAVRDEFSARGQSLAPSARPAPPPVAPPPVAPPPQPAEEEISFDLDSGAAELDFAEPALEIAAEEPAMLVAEEVVEDIAFDLPTAEEVTFEETPEITFEEPAPPVEEPPVFDAFSFEPQAPTPEDIGEVDFYIEQELFEEARTKLAALSARFPGDPMVTKRQQRLAAAVAAAAATAAVAAPAPHP